MQFALFGKLQARRDFIALNMPRASLALWEPWLQAAMSASKMQLNERWQNSFLTAPVWRFWLGPELCGATVAGALMSSMDGVGRYYPLLLIAVMEGSEAIAPPEYGPQDAWFAALDDFLFATLDTSLSYAEIGERLAGLPPAQVFSGAPSAGVAYLPQGGVLALPDAGGLAQALAQARAADPIRAHAASTFWWTAAGQGFQAYALACQRMPDPFLYTGMITGQFSAPAPA